MGFDEGVLWEVRLHTMVLDRECDREVVKECVEGLSGYLECNWKVSGVAWKTECGHEFHASPEDFKYCPFCGGVICYV